MKGKNKGVQAKLLQLNSRAFYVPCGAHTLNLVVADSAKRSPDALGYFGHLTKLFKLFLSLHPKVGCPLEICENHSEIMD